MRRGLEVFCVLILLLSLVPSAVHAEADTEALFPAYTYEGVLRYDAAGIAAGTRVRLYEAESDKHYVIGGRRGGGRVCVPWDAVTPTPKESGGLPAVRGAEIAAYAGAHLSSKTDYLLWVDLSARGFTCSNTRMRGGRRLLLFPAR